jgi:hypothetical protein
MPVIPFSDTAGKAGAVTFWHNAPMGLKAGAVLKVTGIAIVTVVAHCPVAGVKV